ncbi:MAG: hypothetical protein EPO35_08815 [Acidobacteria bacterium]|nr:MAG: hypothetical protein EPO35_08815 [Acidobacteriota bacterium]
MSDQTPRSIATLAAYPLLSALIGRRSSRFAKGITMHEGPLAYASTTGPDPLTIEEEAALAFAACGITGHSLGDLPYGAGEFNGVEEGGGNIMINFTGRTAMSGDASHAVTMFVINDRGVRMLKRPQDFGPDERNALIQLARDHKLVEAYDKLSVQLFDTRKALPRKMPYVAPFNTWDTNLPGTTYFLPVVECSVLYLNILFGGFGDSIGMYVLDDRDNFKPAGIAAFAKSKGGHLDDNPADDLIDTVSLLETNLMQLLTVEVGAMLQNLALMAQALGLGGYPHQAQHPEWLNQLGFTMQDVPFSKVMGFGGFKTTLMELLHKDPGVPTGLGLEVNGAPLIRPYCPPWYPTMADAVTAYLDFKFGARTGTLRDGGVGTGWKDGSAIQKGIAEYPQHTIDAVIAYATYIHDRYGRFPAVTGPVTNLMAFQAHRLDRSFYEKFYQPADLPA